MSLTDNPYEAPKSAAKSAGAKSEKTWMCIVLSIHIVAVLASAYVVRSETILSNRFLEELSALPLASTIVISPATIGCVVVFKRQWTFSAIAAIVADLFLSWFQMYLWLPTVQ